LPRISRRSPCPRSRRSRDIVRRLSGLSRRGRSGIRDRMQRRHDREALRGRRGGRGRAPV